ncbi:hypothetical protein ACFSL4_01460 [Streptomyces caeni]|uniref:DUF317 domain-containing protein n=1 Tax=Streptomyces caeni TaxID=2307231 RepID=A0ABW4IK77_9ACTN
MSIDTPTRQLDYRPTARIDTSDAIASLLEMMAKPWPEYQPVLHAVYGTYGVVRDDSPPNIPYTFDGKPGRVCIGPGGEPWVSVAWNPSGALPLRAWVPASLLKTTGRRW